MGEVMKSVWEAILRDPETGREAWQRMILEYESDLGTDLCRALAPAARVPLDDLVTAEWLESLFVAGDPEAAAEFCGPLSDFLIDTQQDVRRVGEFITSTAIAKLMIELLSPLDGTLYDPASGMGTLLAAGWENREDESGLQLAGQELSSFGWQIAFLRLAMRGAAPDLRTGDTLRDDQFATERFERIVLDPPWGAKDVLVSGGALLPDPRWDADYVPSSTEWLWVRHVLHHLSDSGLAAVLIPSGLTSHRKGAADRSSIIARGDLDVVIDLPPGVAAQSGGAASLLLFDRSRGGRGDNVLFIDARTLGTARRGGPRDLKDEQRKRIVQAVQAWREGTLEPEPRFAAWASGDEVERAAVWTPSRFISYLTRFTTIDGEPMRDRARRLLEEAGPGVPGETISRVKYALDFIANVPHGRGRPWPAVRLGEVLVTEPVHGSRQDTEGRGDRVPYLKTEAVAEGVTEIVQPPKSRTRAKRGTRLAEPGDVLLTSRGVDERRAPRSAVLRTDQPVSYSESLMRLRVDEARLTPEYLRLFLTSREGHVALAAITSGTTVGNIRPEALQDLEVPLPDLETQQQIIEAAQAAEETVAELEAFSARMRDLSDTLHEGLISGVFRTSTTPNSE